MARAFDFAGHEHQIFQPAAGEHLTLSQMMGGSKILTAVFDNLAPRHDRIWPLAQGWNRERSRSVSRSSFRTFA
jgi:hypothetical protein